MRVLAFDCAQRFCAVALYESGADELLADRNPDIGRGHAEILPQLLTEVLADAAADLESVERIAVTIGPGSFAGIRVGVSFARGLALTLGVPSVGIGSLHAIAAPAAARLDAPVMAALDARREQVWTAVVGPDGACLAAPAELSPEAAAALAVETGAQILGSAGPLLLATDGRIKPDRLIEGGDDRVAPAIVDVARLAVGLDPARHLAEPAYLRAPDAKPQTGFAVARAVG